MSNLTIKYQEKEITSNPTGENYLGIVGHGSVRSYENACFFTTDIKTTLEAVGLQAKFIDYRPYETFTFLNQYINPVIEVDKARSQYKAFLMEQLDCMDSAKEELLNTNREAVIHIQYSQDGYNWTPATLRFTANSFWNEVLTTSPGSGV